MTEFDDVISGTGCAACECDRCLDKFYDPADPEQQIADELDELAWRTRKREALGYLRGVPFTPEQLLSPWEMIQAVSLELQSVRHKLEVAHAVLNGAVDEIEEQKS